MVILFGLSDTPARLVVKLTIHCEALTESGTYPIPSARDTSELRNCAVPR